jgi:hypothetical protein
MDVSAATPHCGRRERLKKGELGLVWSDCHTWCSLDWPPLTTQLYHPSFCALATVTEEVAGGSGEALMCFSLTLPEPVLWRRFTACPSATYHSDTACVLSADGSEWSRGREGLPSVSRRVGIGFSLALFLLFYQHRICEWRNWPSVVRRRPAADRLLGVWVLILSLVSVVFCHIEASATDRSLVQRNPNKCVCMCVCQWMWSGATVALYTCYEYVESSHCKKERRKWWRYSEAWPN